MQLLGVERVLAGPAPRAALHRLPRPRVRAARRRAVDRDALVTLRAHADAAHAVPAVVTEMLLDSRPGIIEFLPALPADWGRGTLRGIGTRARA